MTVSERTLDVRQGPKVVENGMPNTAQAKGDQNGKEIVTKNRCHVRCRPNLNGLSTAKHVHCIPKVFKGAIVVAGYY